jgi:hypothetical protein
MSLAISAGTPMMDRSRAVLAQRGTTRPSRPARTSPSSANSSSGLRHENELPLRGRLLEQLVSATGSGQRQALGDG